MIFYPWPPIIAGLELNTTEQTCGPFGTTTADMKQASGHRLLFVSGQIGGALDGLRLHFDYDCTHN